MSAVCSSSEGELCFFALCWICFQADTIPQSRSTELSAAASTGAAPTLPNHTSHAHYCLDTFIVFTGIPTGKKRSILISFDVCVSCIYCVKQVVEEEAGRMILALVCMFTPKRSENVPACWRLDLVNQGHGCVKC